MAQGASPALPERLAKEAALKNNKKVYSSKAAEEVIIDQAIKMGQSDPKQMPGSSRRERRLLARKVRKEMKKRLKHHERTSSESE